MKIENILSLSAIVIALIFGVCSCTQSGSANSQSTKAVIAADEANKISKEALQEAKKSNEISEETNNITLNVASNASVKDSFEEVYDKGPTEELMKTIKKRDSVIQNTDELGRFVDIFEGVGGQYCYGTVTGKDIRLYLGKSLENVCRHHQIMKNFGGHKNGLSILCSRFTEESEFSAFMNQESANNCNFK